MEFRVFFEVFMMPKKISLVLYLIVTGAGIILFFPLNIEGQYTCFFHRLFDQSNPVCCSTDDPHFQHRENEKRGAEDQGIDNSVANVILNPGPHKGSALLTNYLHQYALNACN